MESLGRHLFGIAYVKVGFFLLLKMNVLLKLVLNYLHVLYYVWYKVSNKLRQIGKLFALLHERLCNIM